MCLLHTCRSLPVKLPAAATAVSALTPTCCCCAGICRARQDSSTVLRDGTKAQKTCKCHAHAHVMHAHALLSSHRSSSCGHESDLLMPCCGLCTRRQHRSTSQHRSSTCFVMNFCTMLQQLSLAVPPVQAARLQIFQASLLNQALK